MRRRALLVVLPYLLFGVVWAWTNPVGAAPDEPAHLIKALGVARLDIGTAYQGPADNPYIGGTERNASIARVVPIPTGLIPDGVTCYSLDVEATAACLPSPPPPNPGVSEIPTPVGAYPPFLYLPVGMAALAGDSPAQAIHYGRMAALLLSAALVWVAVTHLLRWLPSDGVVLGLAWALTPMAVFSSAILSVSGLEIAGAAGVAAVVVAGLIRHESLEHPATHGVLALCGSALVLSRQLGVVTLAVFLLVLLLGGAWRPVWSVLRRPRRSAIAAVGALGSCTALVLWWEARYDKPSGLGPVASVDTWRSFLDLGWVFVDSGVGWFGWLETRMPPWSVSLWIAGLCALVGLGLVRGRGRIPWLIAGSLVATAAVAYVVYSVVFSPLGALLQGRHMIPLFLLAPLLAGSAGLAGLGVTERRRALGITAVLVPLLQVVAVWINARRYAVGVSGPVDFVASARWAPSGGWGMWIALTAIAAASMVWMVLRARPSNEQERNSHVGG